MIAEFSLHWRYAWLVMASLIAGVMNAMAGGGSFLSFPAMLAVGVLPIQANATNTVALWPGQLTSVAALRSDLRRRWRDRFRNSANSASMEQMRTRSVPARAQ